MQANLLADGLAQAQFERNVSAEAIRFEARASLALEEIRRVAPDVLCVQEMNHYEEFWHEHLSMLGYEGVFKPKFDKSYPPAHQTVPIYYRGAPSDGVGMLCVATAAILCAVHTSRFADLTQGDKHATQVLIAAEVCDAASGEPLMLASVSHLKAGSGDSNERLRREHALAWARLLSRLRGGGTSSVDEGPPPLVPPPLVPPPPVPPPPPAPPPPVPPLLPSLAPLSCVLCSRADATVAVQRGGLSMCTGCYQSAFKADMAIARKYEFEPADHIAGNVYLGPEGATVEEAWLREHRIDRVLTVAAHMGHLVKHPSIEYMHIDVDDDPSESLRPFFESASEFISRRMDANVLIHCVSGISRSATVVTAHLMQQQGMSYQEALSLVRSRRAVVSPNSGFQAQLLAYEAELRAAREGGPGAEVERTRQPSQQQRPPQPPPQPPPPLLPLVVCGDMNENAARTRGGVRHLLDALGLCSAYAAGQGHDPPYTCIDGGWRDTLDYILISPGLLPTKLWSVPSGEKTLADGSIPSSAYPSDHLSLAVELLLPEKESAPHVHSPPA
eukprot:CAMPEP_0181194598 /NCGR_PEP_ID=MMETSP1096-20121128/14427_1 /TAXON_ID=156174 ORGANISM="Chrysochromulina ericina, Strain CCMP281" /NCGR_SAMPLE_ID=MMETSP1096 /ASSEMBLY_ACC=CAM_ASM_000453 /LENGTH=557 /DNA_ID=CAMNT_0023284121 /DNA_START=29 /DNA_END=1701 /DNA_ORIENTATION=-